MTEQERALLERLAADPFGEIDFDDGTPEAGLAAKLKRAGMVAVERVGGSMTTEQQHRVKITAHGRAALRQR